MLSFLASPHIAFTTYLIISCKWVLVGLSLKSLPAGVASPVHLLPPRLGRGKCLVGHRGRGAGYDVSWSSATHDLWFFLVFVCKTTLNFSSFIAVLIDEKCRLIVSELFSFSYFLFFYYLFMFNNCGVLIFYRVIAFTLRLPGQMPYCNTTHEFETIEWHGGQFEKTFHLATFHTHLRQYKIYISIN